MGVPKHGRESAKTKSSAKYKAEGRRAINKHNKADKIAAGKKIKSRKTPKTNWMKLDTLIRNTSKSRPYFDSANGTVLWGKDKDEAKEKSKGKKKNRGGKEDVLSDKG